MIALSFSCNFYVVMGGGSRVYLLHHLNWKSLLIINFRITIFRSMTLKELLGEFFFLVGAPDIWVEFTLCDSLINNK